MEQRRGWVSVELLVVREHLRNTRILVEDPQNRIRARPRRLRLERPGEVLDAGIGRELDEVVLHEERREVGDGRRARRRRHGGTGDAKLARPLIIDLEADAHVDLEASMKKGVVVIAYDCKSLRVLSNCKLAEGGYDYVGVGRKEQVVQLKGVDELKVNLPLSAGKLGPEVEAGRSIDLALVYVGRRTTLVLQARRADLTGSCVGATHYL